MSFIDLQKGRVNYRFDGSADAEVVVLSNSLGTDLSMWDKQVPELAREFRVLRYDLRGQGLSEAGSGPHSMGGLGQDVVELLDALEIPRAHFCGLSMGGMIGIWLGVYAPERLGKLALCNTAGRIGSAEFWNSRIATVREGGMPSISVASIQRWFTSDFIASAPDVVERARQMLLRSSVEGYIASCEALCEANFIDEVSDVTAQTMVIAGSNDAATPAAEGRLLSAKIPGARYVELHAAHLSNIEAAQEFTDALVQFLNQPTVKQDHTFV